EATQEMWPGATLLLYTDGLIERRGESIELGMARLRREASAYQSVDVDGLCKHVLASLIEGDQRGDDIALVAMGPVSEVADTFVLTLPAEPRMLVELRRELRRWLERSEIPVEDAGDILVACSEACANAVRHAYPTSTGDMMLTASVVDGVLEVTV